MSEQPCVVREALEQMLWHYGSDVDRRVLVDAGKGWKTDTFAAVDLVRAALAALLLGPDRDEGGLIKCTNCAGNGFVEGGAGWRDKCRVCDGSGQIRAAWETLPVAELDALRWDLAEGASNSKHLLHQLTRVEEKVAETHQIYALRISQVAAEARRFGREEVAPLLRSIIAHWDEFGPEHGFDEVIEAARKVVSDGMV